MRTKHRSRGISSASTHPPEDGDRDPESPPGLCEKWEKSFTSESPNLDLPTFIFMRSSTWADEIRRRKSPHNHPKWHYVDYPLKPPKFPVEPGPDPNDDILYGISQCEKTLADAKATPEERAVCLSWLIHLIVELLDA